MCEFSKLMDGKMVIGQILCLIIVTCITGIYSRLLQYFMTLSDRSCLSLSTAEYCSGPPRQMSLLRSMIEHRSLALRSRQWIVNITAFRFIFICRTCNLCVWFSNFPIAFVAGLNVADTQRCSRLIFDRQYLRRQISLRRESRHFILMMQQSKYVRNISTVIRTDRQAGQ